MARSVPPRCVVEATISVASNSSWIGWPIEIDGLPIKNGGNRWFTELKNGDFPVRKVSQITNF